MCCKRRIGWELNGLIRQRHLPQVLKCRLDLATTTSWEQCLRSYCLFLPLVLPFLGFSRNACSSTWYIWDSTGHSQSTHRLPLTYDGLAYDFSTLWWCERHASHRNHVLTLECGPFPGLEICDMMISCDTGPHRGRAASQAQNHKEKQPILYRETGYQCFLDIVLVFLYPFMSTNSHMCVLLLVERRR